MAKLFVTPKQPSSRPDSKGGSQAEYCSVILKAGQKFEVLLQVNGVKVGTLGPWVAVPKTGLNAIAQVRLRVIDDSTVGDFTEVK